MTLGSLLLRATLLMRRSQALQRFEEIRGIPFGSAETAAELQFNALRHLLRHAESNVPWYRRGFAEAGVSARDFRSMDDIARFPVLTKADLRTHAKDLVDERLAPSKLTQYHSGGSTGVPVSFFRERRNLDMSDAGTWRNLAQAGWNPGDMIAYFWGWNDRLYRMPTWEFTMRQWVRRSYQFDPFAAGEAAFTTWIRRWDRFKPVVALGYASALSTFAAWILRTGATVQPVKGIFSTAEVLLPAQRQIIEKAFGAKVYDLYGSSEVQNIAAECPAGSMHVNTDFAVVEVQSTGGVRAPLIVTSLQSWAMPFIRYENGDMGRLLPYKCGCDNSFPLMALDIARVSDNFRMPNGRVIHGEYFTHLMYGVSGVNRFQFHQSTVDNITLRIVGDPGIAMSDPILKVKMAVEALDPSRLRVSVEEVGDIPLSRAGKHRFTRSDVHEPEGGT